MSSRYDRPDPGIDEVYCNALAAHEPNEREVEVIMSHLVDPLDRETDAILLSKKIDLTKGGYDLVALAQGFQEVVAVLHNEALSFFFVVSLDEGGHDLGNEHGGVMFKMFLNGRNADLVSHHFYNGEGDHPFGKPAAYREAIASMARYSSVSNL